MSTTAANARLIDPRGQRFSAGLSVVILSAAFLADQPLVVAAIGLALAFSAGLGMRYWLLGRAWPPVRRLLHLGPPAEFESEYPPRFAQALGAAGLTLASIAFVLGVTSVGWLVTAAVASLQAVLALTGYCLGCRLYFLRWWVPAAFSRLVGAGPRS